jgi:hypothetical protein
MAHGENTLPRAIVDRLCAGGTMLKISATGKPQKVSRGESISAKPSEAG